MKKPHEYLREIRRKTRITQTDIGFLLNHTDNSVISRCESGERELTMDVMYAYHLLFDTQLGLLFPDERERMRSRIVSRINPLIQRIEQQHNTQGNDARVSFLKESLIRLNQPNR